LNVFKFLLHKKKGPGMPPGSNKLERLSWQAFPF
jgi:hypothetical protein